jgi:hypothetical protein
MKAVKQIQSLLLSALLTGLVLITGQSCRREAPSKEISAGSFVVKGFNPSLNVDLSKTLELDYTAAIANGFVIPSVKQCDDGQFAMEFYVRNNGKTPSAYSYKIYYQNESYKFPETSGPDSSGMNPLCAENFYGSWEDSLVTFRNTAEIPADGEFHKVTDRFRIVGNPRCEKRYYGGDVNQRWKRNPRVGEYSFLLVVTETANVKNSILPAEVQNICLQGQSGFMNPYYYFLHGPGKRLPNTVIQKAGVQLKVIARPDLGAGIYENPQWFSKEDMAKYGNPCCGQDSAFYKNAAFEQFIHYIDAGTKLYNIPVVADVLGDNYSKTDYNWNARFYRKEELVGAVSGTAKVPCKTVISDPKEKKITLFNPAVEFGKWEKQNVGVITRHPFTYGKWTVKAKLTELLNKNNLWNGLTNAIWLITHDQAEWNWRRDCSNGGYMANYYGGQQDQRVKNVGYSEIDFEILKTVPYCPSWVLPPAYNYGMDEQHDPGKWNVPLPEEVLENDDRIVVACTNWDMACWDPRDFKDGCNMVKYGDTVFWAHRWDKNYRALTEKVLEKDDELFGSQYYYFQIDWRPTEIIWRIGPSKDKLRVVGYVNDQVTCIPNNEMLLIVTQEFHNTKWWIGSMYQQENIPFPSKNIVGEIYEVTIE